MRKNQLLLLPLCCLFAFSACNDKNTTCEFHFGTTESALNEQWTLYIDGQNMGVLPNPEQEVSCENTNGALDSLIHVTLDGTRHEFEALDTNGTIRSKGYFKVTENQSRIGSNDGGGSSSEGSCDCMLMYIFD
jgi:hypothetical protein